MKTLEAEAFYTQLAQALTERFGDCRECVFLRPGERLDAGLQLRMDEMAQRLGSGREGSYRMQWQWEGVRIQFWLHMDEAEECSGFLCYSG